MTSRAHRVVSVHKNCQASPTSSQTAQNLRTSARTSSICYRATGLVKDGQSAISQCYVGSTTQHALDVLASVFTAKFMTQEDR